MRHSRQIIYHRLIPASALVVTLLTITAPLPGQKTGRASNTTKPPQNNKKAGLRGLPPGTAKVWEDRGELTPAKVYWGAAGKGSDPLSRLPAPPFSHFQKDTTENATSPKARLKDSKGVEWTAKFGVE